MALPETVPFIGWRWDDVLFLTLGGLMLGAALLVVLGRDIIRSGLFMILAFGALAGIYVLLGAPIVAGAQVLVYIGAISVLILFAIMITQSKAAPSRLVFQTQSVAAGLATIVLAVLLIGMLVATDWPLAIGERLVSGAAEVGRRLFADYVLAFEVVSVLLLAAVIGGVFLAKREDAPDPGERSIEPTLGRIERPVTAGPVTAPFPAEAANAARQAERIRSLAAPPGDEPR